jgi:hypothetical protein
VSENVWSLFCVLFGMVVGAIFGAAAVAITTTSMAVRAAELTAIAERNLQHCDN